MKRVLPCPVAGCPHDRLRWHAVCAACWGRLPADYRERIGAAKAAGAAHLAAKAEMAATAWLAAQLVAARREAPG